jgi:hypothetical protein
MRLAAAERQEMESLLVLEHFNPTINPFCGAAFGYY